MKFTPRPYQRLIVNHILSRERTAVWAGMGMGKTSSTLYAINLLQSVEGVGPALILAPLRVAVSTWPDEVAKWEDFSHMRVSVLYGSKAQRKKSNLPNRPPDDGPVAPGRNAPSVAGSPQYL